MSVLDTLDLLVGLFRRRSQRDLTLDHVQWWAGQHELEVIALEPCRKPPADILRDFPPAIVPREQSEHRYFEIAAIDDDHVRRRGVVRVYHQVEVVDDLDVTVHAVWLTTEQLDWRSRPPRSTATVPHAHAQGWYADPDRAHELRWYSAGQPTDLVKDGAIESRDPPPRPSA